MQEESTHPAARMSRSAWGLALAGYLPFLALAIVIALSGPTQSLYSSVVDLFKLYSALILSFLGGVRWGAAIVETSKSDFYQADTEDDPRPLALSVVPAIIAWFALLLPDHYCILVLLLCFCAQGAWDSWSANSGVLPIWFGKLRIVLTALVAAAHIVVFISIA